MTRLEPSSSNNLLPHLAHSPHHQPPLLLFLPLSSYLPRSASFCCLPLPFLSTRLSSFSLSDQILLNTSSPFRSFDVCSLFFFFFTIASSLPSFLGPAPLNPQGPLVDEGRFEYESCSNYASWMIMMIMMFGLGFRTRVF